MGSVNSANPVHYVTSLEYRRMVKRLNTLLQLARENEHIMGVKQRHDVMLAKKAVLASVYLTHSGSGLLPYSRNATAKDYSKLAYNEVFFGASFDAQMEAYK
jgi:5-keto 4-deoxyuronate isomerase